MKTLASIVVPVYQNEDNLETTIPSLLSLQNQLPNYTIELILVDDGSTDSSLHIISRLSRENPGVITAVKLTRNFGQSAAIQAGLEIARGECTIIISADLQEPYEVIPELISQWEQGSKFVIGERRYRAESYFHRIMSGFYWWLIRTLVFSKFPKLGYDFCLIDQIICSEIVKIREKNTSIFALIYWLGFEHTAVPIERRLRCGGQSQWTMRKKLNFTIDTVIGFSYAPARFITFAGFAAMFGAMAYLAFLFVHWFSSADAPPGWMTLAALILIFGSLNLFALGIVSEYVLRVLDESRRRALVIVETVVRHSSGELDLPTPLPND
jgi:polyisoprenyl-phosphate glycosyltransferase